MCTCVECIGFQPEPPEENSEPILETELFDADPNCEHDLQDARGGGVKCSKCPGWFCY